MRPLDLGILASALLIFMQASAARADGRACPDLVAKARAEFAANRMSPAEEAGALAESSRLIAERVSALRSALSQAARERIGRYLDASDQGYDRPKHDEIRQLLEPIVTELQANDLKPSCDADGSSPAVMSDGLSACQRLEAEESHYLQALVDRITGILPGGAPRQVCEASCDLGPVRCHLATTGIPTDQYHSKSYPALETRVSMQLDGYDRHFRQWKDGVPRSGQAFQFTVCAQVSKLVSKIGIQSARGCARFDLAALAGSGEPRPGLSVTGEPDYLAGQTDWCH